MKFVETSSNTSLKDRGAQLHGVLAVALRAERSDLSSLCSVPITGQCRTTKDQLSYFNPGQL